MNNFINIYKIPLILASCFFIMIPEVLPGAGSAGTSAADFLELGVGSRPLAMGEAFTSEINDINSIYYNPAGLATLKYPMVSVNHQELILDSRFENVSFAYPIYNGYLGVSNSLFWVPPFDKIDIDGNTVGKVNFYNGAFTAAYGYNLEFMYVGASMKYIYQKVDDKFYFYPIKLKLTYLIIRNKLQFGVQGLPAPVARKPCTPNFITSYTTRKT